MYVNSNLLNSINLIFHKIQDKFCFLTEKSYLFTNIDNILFVFICLSFVASIFLGNNSTAPFLFFVGILYFISLCIKKGAEIRINKSSFFIILYFIMGLISTINSTMLHQSLFGLSKTVLYLLFFCATMQYLRLNRDKVFFLSIVIASCVSFEIIVAFIQNYFDVLSAATWQDTSRLNPEQILTRVYGTLKPSNPNLLGGYFIAAIPFLWLTAVISFIKKFKIFFIITLLLSFLSVPAVFMTGCRGAYLALFAMIFFLMIIFCFVIKKHYPTLYEYIKIKKNIIISSILAGIAFVMVAVPKISQRILSIFAMRNDSSTSFRMNVYNSSIEMFQDNFLFGIGCGNKVFREIYGLYMFSGYDALSAYSIYLETAVESGIFALIFYLLFVFFLIKHAIFVFLKSDNLEIKLILAAGFLSVIGVLIHGFVDTVYFRPQIQLVFWSAVAMIYSYTDELYSNK